MKINIIILILSTILLLFGINCLGQEELKAPEKDEIVKRIKNDIQQYNDKWQPEVRKLLLKGDAGITKEELDSLMIIITPTFKIKENCLIKSDLMKLIRYYDNSFSDEYYYNYIIIPDSNKHTLYSSIGEIYNSDQIENIKIEVYTKGGKWRHSTGIPEGYDLSKPLHILKYNTKFGNLDDYSFQSLVFFIKSSKVDERAKAEIRGYNPIKIGALAIYNNRIYSCSCLGNKFPTSDLNKIFDNNPCNICDCDIDVYFRINEKADEVK